MSKDKKKEAKSEPILADWIKSLTAKKNNAKARGGFIGWIIALLAGLGLFVAMTINAVQQNKMAKELQALRNEQQLAAAEAQSLRFKARAEKDAAERSRLKAEAVVKLRESVERLSAINRRREELEEFKQKISEITTEEELLKAARGEDEEV